VKIAFSTFEYDRNLNGGAGIYALELSTYLQRYCELTVYSLEAYQSPLDTFTAEWYGKGASIVRYKQVPRLLKNRRGFLPFYYYALFQAKVDECDVHLVNDYSQGVTAPGRKPIVQILHHLHSSDLKYRPGLRSRLAGRVMAASENRALIRAQAIMCDSRDTMERATSKYPKQANKMRVVPSGVDVDLFKPPNGGLKRSIDGETPLILSIARGLETRKGISYLIEAFAAVRRVFDVRLIIVGNDSHGQKPQILRQARSLGVIDAITFIDSVSLQDLIELYQYATVTVVSSLLEGFSKPTLESMACGTPVIGTAVGAIPELVDESSGVLVDPGDSTALAAALIALLSDAERVMRMGVAARERAITHFAWDSVVKKVICVCEEAVSA
jgi:glycosyltransferase involved in cell wall biosynthesis